MSQASDDSRPVVRNGARAGPASLAGLWHWLRGLFRPRNGESALRDTLEEIIGEIEESAPEKDGAGQIVAAQQARQQIA